MRTGSYNTIRFGVEADERLPTLGPASRGWLTEKMRALIFQEADVAREFTCPDCLPVVVHLDRAGTTAAVATFSRADASGALIGRLVAIMLAGIDHADDAKAIEVARGIIPESPCAEDGYRAIAAEPRPLLALVVTDPVVADERTFDWCAEAMAVAYFDQFGIGGEAQA